MTTEDVALSGLSAAMFATALTAMLVFAHWRGLAIEKKSGGTGDVRTRVTRGFLCFYMALFGAAVVWLLYELATGATRPSAAIPPSRLPAFGDSASV